MQGVNLVDYGTGGNELKIWNTTCINCGIPTPHAEDAVMDRESATVWHCPYCGTEIRPPEKGTPNEPVKV